MENDLSAASRFYHMPRTWSTWDSELTCVDLPSLAGKQPMRGVRSCELTRSSIAGFGTLYAVLEGLFFKRGTSIQSREVVSAFLITN